MQPCLNRCMMSDWRGQSAFHAGEPHRGHPHLLRGVPQSTVEAPLPELRESNAQRLESLALGGPDQLPIGGDRNSPPAAGAAGSPPSAAAR